MGTDHFEPILNMFRQIFCMLNFIKIIIASNLFLPLETESILGVIMNQSVDDIPETYSLHDQHQQFKSSR